MLWFQRILFFCQLLAIDFDPQKGDIITAIELQRRQSFLSTHKSEGDMPLHCGQVVLNVQVELCGD